MDARRLTRWRSAPGHDPDAEGNTPYDIATGNDADSDRHGIVTPDGLMNPNHFLAVAIEYLFTHRPGWGEDAAVGKTLVSSALIDRVVAPWVASD